MTGQLGEGLLGAQDEPGGGDGGCCGWLFDTTPEEIFRWDVWLPPWGSDQQVREEARAGMQQGRRLTLFPFAGPALWNLILPMAPLWLFAALYPFVVLRVSVCPEPTAPFAHFPFLVSTLYLPLLAWLLRSEWCSLKLITPTYAVWLGQFKVLGKQMTFVGWLTFVGMLSLVAKLDVVTNGLFLAKILKTCSCQGGLALEIISRWRTTIADSVVWWVPFIDDIGSLVTIVWICVFIQPLVCLLISYPVKGLQNIDFGERSEGAGYLTIWAYLRSRKGNKHHVHHADVLKQVAFVNRMTTIVDQSVSWILRRADMEGEWIRTSDIVLRETMRITLRLWVYTFFERFLMLEVQASIFALSRSLMRHDQPWWQRMDGQMLASIFVTLVSFGKEMFDLNWQQATLRLSITNLMDSDKPVVDEHGDRVTDAEQVQNMKASTLAWVEAWFFSMRIGFWVLLAGLIHCLLKLFMAFFCYDSIFDIPTPWSKGVDRFGCVLHLPSAPSAPNVTQRLPFL